MFWGKVVNRYSGFIVLLMSIFVGAGCKPVPPTQSGVGGTEGLPVGADSTYFFPNDFQVRVGRYAVILCG